MLVPILLCSLMVAAIVEPLAGLIFFVAFYGSWKLVENESRLKQLEELEKEYE